MIGRIAVNPVLRGYAWHHIQRHWRMPVWWRLALARIGEQKPVSHSLETEAAVARDRPSDSRPSDSRPSAQPDPRVATDALYQRHARAVLGYLAGRMPDLADAEDALGEVFVVALQACAAGVSPDLPWLLLVARRRVADFYRARARGATMRAHDKAEATNTSLADPRAQPEELSLRAEEERELGVLIARLPDEQREALALRFAAGLRAAQIGAVMGKSEEAVRALLSRAVRRLRQEWGKEEIG